MVRFRKLCHPARKYWHKASASLTVTERWLCFTLIFILIGANATSLYYGISHFIQATTKPVVAYSQETITKFPQLGLIMCSASTIPISSPILNDGFEGPVAVNSYLHGPSVLFYPNQTYLNGYLVYIFAMGDIDLSRHTFSVTNIYGNVKERKNWTSSVGILPFDLQQGVPTDYDPLSFHEAFFPLNGMSQIHANVIKLRTQNKVTYSYVIRSGILRFYRDDELPINFSNPVGDGSDIASFTFNISIGWDTLNNIMEVKEDYISYTIFDIVATILAILNFSIWLFYCIFPNVPLVVTTPKFRFSNPGPLVFDPYASKMGYNVDFMVPRSYEGVGLGAGYESDSEDGFTNLI